MPHTSLHSIRYLTAIRHVKKYVATSTPQAHDRLHDIFTSVSHLQTTVTRGTLPVCHWPQQSVLSSLASTEPSYEANEHRNTTSLQVMLATERKALQSICYCTSICFWFVKQRNDWLITATRSLTQRAYPVTEHVSDYLPVILKSRMRYIWVEGPRVTVTNTADSHTRNHAHTVETTHI